jgi:hypothetical protein
MRRRSELAARGSALGFAAGTPDLQVGRRSRIPDPRSRIPDPGSPIPDR